MLHARLQPGDPAPAFTLPRLGGGTFASTALAGGRWLLGFQRYAT